MNVKPLKEYTNYLEDWRLTNLDDLCMNYIRDSIFELIDRGYDVEPLEDIIEYFELKYDWRYNQDAEGYELFNVNTDEMSEVDEMHELTTATTCLTTLLMDELISNKQYETVYALYERAYNDCIKVLCYGWKRGEPKMTEEPTPYDKLCDEQKIINSRGKTRLCSIYD